MARGAVLHDFFFDIPIEQRQKARKFLKGFKKIKVTQSYRHPQLAAQNAQKYFDVSEMEEDIISKHMFPLTPEKPSYAESWVVNGVDTTIAIKEFFQTFIEHPYRTISGQINNTI